jgi:hypothetical protein
MRRSAVVTSPVRFFAASPRPSGVSTIIVRLRCMRQEIGYQPRQQAPRIHEKSRRRPPILSRKSLDRSLTRPVPSHNRRSARSRLHGQFEAIQGAYFSLSRHSAGDGGTTGANWVVSSINLHFVSGKQCRLSVAPVNTIFVASSGGYCCVRRKSSKLFPAPTSCGTGH